MNIFIPPFVKGSNSPAVYKIHFDEKWFYIGSAKNVRTRLSIWKSNFKKGSYDHNKNINLLLPSVKKIRFEYLEFVQNLDELRKRETYHISNHLNDPLLLNICPDGEFTRKLSDEDVRFIRRNYRIMGRNELANKFKIHHKTVTGIAAGRLRGDIDGEVIHRHIEYTKIIVDINTGVFYESTRELAILLGVKVDPLRYKLNDPVKNNTSYRYV